MRSLGNRLSWPRLVEALLGLVTFVGGAVALFTIDNSAGSLFLIALGVALVLHALLGGRIKLDSFELLGAKLRVEEVVKGRLQLAREAGAGDEDGQDRVVREQALTLQKLAGLYDLYEYIRGTQPFSDRRTADLDGLAAKMRAAAREAEFDSADVSAWFHNGDDALRVVALNLMLARADCRDFMAVLKTVDEPRSNFEQYYGLRLGWEMRGSLDDLQRRLLADAIERAQRSWRFRRDKHLMGLSTTLLTELKQ